MTKGALSRLAAAASAGLLAVGVHASVRAADNVACGLLTPAELAATLGGSVALKGSLIGTTQMCSGQAGTRYVMVRYVTKSEAVSEQEAAARVKQGVEAAKQRGADVETKKFGPVFCMAILSHAPGKTGGFDTTCTYSKPPRYAVVEITTSSQKDAISIDQLHALAEKMGGRF